MAKQTQAPRKQRTRQHVIADLSVHYVEGFVLEEGHTAQRLDQDYGYDLVMMTYDEHGYIEASLLFIQLKAAESLRKIGSVYVFDIDIRDYNLWTQEGHPVIPILFDASRKRAYWLHIQGYFRGVAQHPKKSAKTIRVRIPAKQAMNRKAIERMREIKRTARLSLWGDQA